MFTNNADYLTSVVSLKRNVVTEDSLLKASNKSSKSSGWTVPNWGSKAQEDDADMATRTCQAKYMDGVGQILLLHTAQRTVDSTLTSQRTCTDSVTPPCMSSVLQLQKRRRSLFTVSYLSMLSVSPYFLHQHLLKNLSPGEVCIYVSSDMLPCCCMPKGSAARQLHGRGCSIHC